MAKTASVPVLKARLTRERRANRRLRALLADVQQELQANRRDLNLQIARMAQVQAEVDILKTRKPA